jgi:hypothetical protein
VKDLIWGAFADTPHWSLTECKCTQYLMPLAHMLCLELDIHYNDDKSYVLEGLLRSCWGRAEVPDNIKPTVHLQSLSSDEEADKAAVQVLKNMDECQRCGFVNLVSLDAAMQLLC